MEGAIIQIDKQSSVTSRVDLEDIAYFGRGIGREGDVILVEALRSYGAVSYIETPSGRLAKIHMKDKLLGVLGNRDATRAIVGRIPRRGIKVTRNIRLHLLCAGGVIGKAISFVIRHGSPLPVRPIGLAYNDEGKIINIKDYGIPWRKHLGRTPPIVMLVSTSMESGKTTAAVEIIGHLTKIEGYKVAGVKLTGVARMRDILRMKDAGANPCFSFVDAGLPSTTTIRHKVTKAAKGILHKVSEANPDIIVAEMGGSILGEGVPYILEDHEIMKNVKAIILSALDEVGAYGGVKLLREQYGLEVTAITGPATDDKSGIKRISKVTGVPAYNMLKGRSSDKLVDLILEKLELQP